jgi:hypothetical protein
MNTLYKISSAPIESAKLITNLKDEFSRVLNIHKKDFSLLFLTKNGDEIQVFLKDSQHTKKLLKHFRINGNYEFLMITQNDYVNFNSLPLISQNFIFLFSQDLIKAW